MRCAWPADRKGSHTTIDCYQPVEVNSGTVAFPKAKEYPKMKIGGYQLEEDEEDLYTEESSSEELRDTPLVSSNGQQSSSEQISSEQSSSKLSSETPVKWWQSD